MLLFHSANGRSYPGIPFPEIVSDSLSQQLGLFFWFNVTFSTSISAVMAEMGLPQFEQTRLASLDVIHI